LIPHILGTPNVGSQCFVSLTEKYFVGLDQCAVIQKLPAKCAVIGRLISQSGFNPGLMTEPFVIGSCGCGMMCDMIAQRLTRTRSYVINAAPQRIAKRRNVGRDIE
jgi:hypothetical protein